MLGKDMVADPNMHIGGVPFTINLPVYFIAQISLPSNYNKLSPMYVNCETSRAHALDNVLPQTLVIHYKVRGYNGGQ